MKKVSKILSIIITMLLLVGCSVSNEKSEQAINKISSKEAKEIIDTDENIVIIDVREKSEYNEGHIKNSILIPLGTVEGDIESIVTNKDKKILLYCRSGRRSAEAANILQKLGYTNIYDFGGINDWSYEIEK